MLCLWFMFFFFFFNDTATTEIYTLSLHDALPISQDYDIAVLDLGLPRRPGIHSIQYPQNQRDRKSTRLNSSHTVISYAVFCLKKKKTRENDKKGDTKTMLTPLYKKSNARITHEMQ